MQFPRWFMNAFIVTFIGGIFALGAASGAAWVNYRVGAHMTENGRVVIPNGNQTITPPPEPKGVVISQPGYDDKRLKIPAVQQETSDDKPSPPQLITEAETAEFRPVRVR